MFATVEVLFDRKQKVIIVPTTSVVFAPYGDSVYLVERQQDAAVARQRFVRLGDRRGDFVAVSEGLKPGEEVVTRGQYRVQAGSLLATKVAGSGDGTEPKAD
jgi:membrane fusion protein (multidrug efflux system)